MRALHWKVLPHTMLEKAQQFGDKFKLMLESRVVKVEQDQHKVLMMRMFIMFGDFSYPMSHHHLMVV